MIAVASRRALNALRKRRSDKHMICCLSLTAVVLLAAGAGAGAAWRLLSAEVSWLGPLVILGPILVLAGILVIGFTVEICVRLRRQVKRQTILLLYQSHSRLNLTTDQFTRYCEGGGKSMIFRVMDPSLLKTSNLHEVKHWVEPGEA